MDSIDSEVFKQLLAKVYAMYLADQSTSDDLNSRYDRVTIGDKIYKVGYMISDTKKAIDIKITERG